MKKTIMICGYLLLLAGSHVLLAQNHVGIGTSSPANLLDVQGLSTQTSSVINARVNYTGTTQVNAMEGYAVQGDGYGLGGKFSGGYRGIESYGIGGANSGSVMGVLGWAAGSAGSRYGLYGLATGGTTNYGVYGLVTGGANNYAIYGVNTNDAGFAGYFDGRGLFKDNLNILTLLGIGTSAEPTTKLQILGGSDVSLTTNGFVQMGATTGWNLILDDNEIMARNNGAGNDFLIQQDAGNILMCGLEQGRVGIGVQLASNLPTGYMLAVDGKIIGEELRIQNSSSWPDYVFEKDYDRMSLEELRESITENKHLPNVPSAAEVANDGILVGDMQKRMMEKIEELTLYILDLNDECKRLKAEVEALKKIPNR